MGGTRIPTVLTGGSRLKGRGELQTKKVRPVHSKKENPKRLWRLKFLQYERRRGGGKGHRG